MANKKVTDLTAITTAPVSGVMHFIDTGDTSQNAAGSSFKVTKADFLKENTAAILLNTAKVGITPTQATAITNNTAKVGYTDTLVSAAPSVVLNTAKVGITPSQTLAITSNTSKVGYTEALVNANTSVVANTAKVGITTGQASSITTNNAKVGYTDALVATAPTVVANTAKVGITPTQASAITANTAKVGYTEALVASAPSVVLNTAKVGITSTQATAIVANTAKVGITPAQATNITTNASGLAAALISITNNINNACSKYVADFTNRVLVDVGLLESLSNVTTNLRTLYASTFFNKVSLLYLPAGTKASKSYSLLPENAFGDLTVVRNTTATRTNVLGNDVSVAVNVPRLNYDVIGGQPFLLAEPQRTNRLLNSDVVVDQSITTTAVLQTLSFKGTGTITIGGTFTGSLAGTGVNNRVNLTFTPTAGTLTITVTGSCTVGQLTNGAFSTTYIPTTGAAITRNADVLTRNNLYTNNLLSDSGGTFFIEIVNNVAFVRDLFNTGISIFTADNANGFFIGSPGPSSFRLAVRKRVSSVDTLILSTTTDIFKLAIKWNGSTADLFLNGVRVVSSTAFPSADLQLLTLDGSDVPKSIKSFIIASTPLTDAECVTLTTL